MVKLKLRFMIIVLKFIEIWAIKNDWMEDLLINANDLKCDLEVELGGNNDKTKT